MDDTNERPVASRGYALRALTAVKYLVVGVGFTALLLAASPVLIGWVAGYSLMILGRYYCFFMGWADHNDGFLDEMA